MLDSLLSLLPFFQRDTVLEDLRITRNELAVLIKLYGKEAVTVFKAGRFTSKEVQLLQDLYNRGVTGRTGKPNLIHDIAEKLENLHRNLDVVEDLIEKSLEKDIVRDGLTAKKATLIKASEYAGFCSNYAADLLNYIYLMETPGDEKVGEITPVIVKDLTENASNFARLLSILGQPEKGFLKMLDNLPEVILNPKTAQSLMAVYGEAKLNPFAGQLTKGFQGWPIYYARLAVAEWQTRRYKANQDRVKMLELRRLDLELQQKQDPNPKVQQEIGYLNNRIESLRYDMKKMEESVS
jgi:hypothetical protein